MRFFRPPPPPGPSATVERLSALPPATGLCAILGHGQDPVLDRPRCFDCRRWQG